MIRSSSSDAPSRYSMLLTQRHSGTNFLYSLLKTAVDPAFHVVATRRSGYFKHRLQVL